MLESLSKAISIRNMQQLRLFEGMKYNCSIGRIVSGAFQPLDDFALLPEELPTLLDMPFSFFQSLNCQMPLLTVHANHRAGTHH